MIILCSPSIISSSINCPCHTPLQNCFGLFPLSPHLRTAYFCLDTLFAHCWTLACLWNILLFSTLSTAMLITMLICKIDPMDVTNLACARAMHFKTSFVITTSDCLLCSDILTNFLDFLVFTCQYNTYSRFTACSGSILFWLFTRDCFKFSCCMTSSDELLSGCWYITKLHM